MANIIYLSGEISKDLLHEFVDTLNGFETTVGTKVYLETCGGNLGLVGAFRDILETNRMELIATGKLMSAGLFIYLTSNVTKKCLGGTLCMHHHPHVSDISINTVTRKPILKDMEYLKIYYDESTGVQALSRWLEITEEEEKGMKKGDDIFFSKERLDKAEENRKKEVSKFAK